MKKFILPLGIVTLLAFLVAFISMFVFWFSNPEYSEMQIALKFWFIYPLVLSLLILGWLKAKHD